jgi:hypothetical protein
MCVIFNSVSWEPLYLIYQVLYQSSGTNWSYHGYMKIVSLIEMALNVIVYMQSFWSYFFIIYERASRFSYNESNI